MDITVKYAEQHPDSVGACLAPTWALVGGWKHYYYAEKVARAKECGAAGTPEHLKLVQRLAQWSQYQPLTQAMYTDMYVRLLRYRFAANRAPFLELASRESVTLVCYCAGVHAGEFCHRGLAVEVLYNVATKTLGRTALVGGETV